MNIKQIIDFKVLAMPRLYERLRYGENFSLGRFGDGEWKAIKGDHGANCDSHPYYKQMGQDLANVLLSLPDYYIGLHESKKERLDEWTLNWLGQNYLVWGEHVNGEFHAVPNTLLNFVPNALFHDALVGKDNNGRRTIKREGIINELWESLQSRRVCLIAPEYAFSQNQVEIDELNSVSIPGQETYFFLDEIKRECDTKDFTGAVVLISASMCAPLLVDYLYNQYLSTATFIDFGCVWDHYVESPFSRNFFKYAQ